MKKIKWLSIAILLIFVVSFCTSFIPNAGIRYGVSSLLGVIIGFWCMSEYLLEN